MKVVCINDKNRPNEIPTSKWIKEKTEYTVIKADYLSIQNKILGYQLEEIDLTDCFPYLYFVASRFAIVKPDEEMERIVEEEMEEELEEELEFA